MAEPPEVPPDETFVPRTDPAAASEGLSPTAARLNTALESRYRIEAALDEGGQSRLYATKTAVLKSLISGFAFVEELLIKKRRSCQPPGRLFHFSNISIHSPLFKIATKSEATSLASGPISPRALAAATLTAMSFSF